MTRTAFTDCFSVRPSEGPQKIFLLPARPLPPSPPSTPHSFGCITLFEAAFALSFPSRTPSPHCLAVQRFGESQVVSGRPVLRASSAAACIAPSAVAKPPLQPLTHDHHGLPQHEQPCWPEHQRSPWDALLTCPQPLTHHHVRRPLPQAQTHQLTPSPQLSEQRPSEWRGVDFQPGQFGQPLSRS